MSRVATKQDLELLREQMAGMEARMELRETLGAIMTRTDLYQALVLQTIVILTSMFAMLKFM